MEHEIASTSINNNIEVFLMQETLTDNSIVYNVCVQITFSKNNTSSISNKSCSDESEAQLLYQSVIETFEFFDID